MKNNTQQNQYDEVFFDSKNIIDSRNASILESDRKGFITKDIPTNLALLHSYVNFELSDDDLQDSNGEKIYKVYVNDQKAYDIIYGLLIKEEATDFWNAVQIVEEAVRKNKANILKFRGDLAEAIFCLNRDAEKNLDDNSSSDVYLNGEQIEIKSLHNNKMEFTISKEQSENDIRTFSVLIIQQKKESGGMTIVQIANSFEGRNANFKKYLLETYSDTDVGNMYSYRVDNSVISELTSIVHKSITMPEMISATLRIDKNKFNME